MLTFKVRAERDDSHVRIHASGEVDLATAPRIQACARECIRGGTEVVELDLRDVGFIDSTGVRLLLTLAAEGERDGWSLAILPSAAVERIVCLLGLQRQLLAPPSAVEQRPLSLAG